MDKFWNIFENMDNYIFVADIETYEIVFMNKKMRDELSITPEQLAQGKCHELLHKCQKPCYLCNGKELKVGEFVKRTAYRATLNKTLSIQNTLVELDGRKLRVEFATVLEEGKGISDKHEFEKFINEGLRMSLDSAKPDDALMVMMEYIGEALDADRTYIFEKNALGNDDNTYEWVAAGVTAEKDNLQNVPAEVCASWYNSFSVNENIVIKNLEDIREKDPLQYENLKGQNIHSLVVVPLYEDGKAIGFYGVDNPPEDKLEFVNQLLETIGYFIVGALKRRNLVQSLTEMSCLDQLTQFGNRYAMHAYVEEHVGAVSNFGLVYCDVTGLKRVNDSEGHVAGDQLLLRACNCMRDVFGEGQRYYRIGGDEFLVFCENIAEQELSDKVQKLRDVKKDYNVEIAIGTVWQENGDLDIDELLMKAETMMYKDKSEYYKRSGIERRR